MAGLALPRKRRRELVQLSPEALDSVSMSAAEPDYNRADDYDVEGALSDKWYDGIGLRRDVERVGALARVGAAGAMEGLPALASLPRAIAGAIHAEPGERLQGAMQGFRERYESIPGTAGIDEKMRLALRDAKRAGVPSAATFAAEIGTPGLEDFAKLAAIKAFHGSPYRFDKFSAEKIGTGEGAQAYGHGLYFAESPGVARDYGRSLTDELDDELFYIDNELVDLGKMPVERSEAAEMVAREGSFVEAKKFLHGMGRNRYTAEQWMDVRRELESFRDSSGHIATVPRRPSIYETTLDVDHEDLLDWDAPLSEQSPKVREALGRLASPEGPLTGNYANKARNMLNDSMQTMEMESTTGETVMRLLGGDDEAVEALRSAGIPGIRYLDGMSRGRAGGTVLDPVLDGGKWRGRIGFDANARLQGSPQTLTKSPLFDTREEAMAWAEAEAAGGTRNIVMFPGTEDSIRIDAINGEPVRGGLARGPVAGGSELAEADLDVDEVVSRFNASIEARHGVQVFLGSPMERGGRPVIELTDFVVPKDSRKQGIGSRVLEDVNAFADAHGFAVRLTPDVSLGGTSKARLARFYRRHGYKNNKGRNKDFTIFDSMYRDPEGSPKYKADGKVTRRVGGLAR